MNCGGSQPWYLSFGKYGIIDSEDQAEGWPGLQSLPAPSDTDQDGMPDAWESKHQLNVRDAADRNGKTVAPPYTNLGLLE